MCKRSSTECKFILSINRKDQYSIHLSSQCHIVISTALSNLCLHYLYPPDCTTMFYFIALHWLHIRAFWLCLLLLVVQISHLGMQMWICYLVLESPNSWLYTHGRRGMCIKMYCSYVELRQVLQANPYMFYRYLYPNTIINKEFSVKSFCFQCNFTYIWIARDCRGIHTANKHFYLLK